MSLIVQKFGGTSVADIACMHKAADKIIAAYKQNHQVVVVVSAMSGKTDELLNIAHQISATPNARELDVLLATGEQVTIALLSMLLVNLGYKAKSYTGAQLKITTDNTNGKARIINIDTNNLYKDLNAGYIVVVAGFQGVDSLGNITTLGRGGSDTTATALAAALKAKECQIYTDVTGIFTADPKIVPNARKMSQVTFEEILELSSLGSKVLQLRAVEFAGMYNIPLRVLSTFSNEDHQGTLISYEEPSMEQNIVSGIAYNPNEARIVVRGVSDCPGVAGKILTPISEANIEVDMVVQNLAVDGTTDFTFTVDRKDADQACSILDSLATTLKISEIKIDKKIVKLSLVGIGMRSHSGIASKMFNALGKAGINIQLITTSEIKVSVVLDEKYLELGVRILHEAFEL